jgi:hypothetical protein
LQAGSIGSGALSISMGSFLTSWSRAANFQLPTFQVERQRLPDRNQS